MREEGVLGRGHGPHGGRGGDMQISHWRCLQISTGSEWQWEGGSSENGRLKVGGGPGGSWGPAAWREGGTSHPGGLRKG